MQILLTIVALLGVLLLAFAALTTIGRRHFDRRSSAAVEELTRQPSRAAERPITAADLSELPEPIARYLRFADVVGGRRIAGARLEQTGEFRRGSDGSWMSMEATQHVSTNPPGFVWNATIEMMPVVPFRVRDQFRDGTGRMLGTVAGTFPVVDASGPELDQGTLMRFLGEAAWYPTVFLEDFVSWESIDENRARLVAEVGGTEVSAVCHFDGDGAFRKFGGERYFEREGEYTLESWFGTHSQYREIDGLKVPTRSSASWDLDDGAFEYVRLDVRNVDFEFAGTPES